MPISSIVFLSSTPETAGAMASAITFSVHFGSRLANGSQSGFQLPVAFLRCIARRALRAVEAVGTVVSSLMSCRLRSQSIVVRRLARRHVAQVGLVSSRGDHEDDRGK